MAERLIDLRKLDQPNEIYILQLPGQLDRRRRERRRLRREARHQSVSLSNAGRGVCMKVAEFDDAENLESLDLPYHATAFPNHLARREGEAGLKGVADKQLVFSYREDLGQ